MCAQGRTDAGILQLEIEFVSSVRKRIGMSHMDSHMQLIVRANVIFVMTCAWRHPAEYSEHNPLLTILRLVRCFRKTYLADPEKGRAHCFRTRMRERGTEGPNFVDRFTVFPWACGRDRIEFVIVDAKRGNSFSLYFKLRYDPSKIWIILLFPIPRASFFLRVGSPYVYRRDGMQVLRFTLA